MVIYVDAAGEQTKSTVCRFVGMTRITLKDKHKCNKTVYVYSSFYNICCLILKYKNTKINKSYFKWCIILILYYYLSILEPWTLIKHRDEYKYIKNYIFLLVYSNFLLFIVLFQYIKWLKCTKLSLMMSSIRIY
jgi:hypothetical protein